MSVMYRLMLYLLVLAVPFQNMAAAAQVHLAPAGHSHAVAIRTSSLYSHALATKSGDKQTESFVERCDEHHATFVQSAFSDSADDDATPFFLHSHDKHGKYKCSCSASSCISAAMLPCAPTLQKTAASSIEFAQSFADIFLHGPVPDAIDRPPRQSSSLAAL